MAIQPNIPSYGNVFFNGDTYADLAAIPTRKIKDGYAALVKGRYDPTDQSGGLFFWYPDAADVESETVVAPVDGTAGRWIKNRASINLSANNGSALVGYGTRTVAGKLGDFVSVKDFGAKGDGTTDDTAAVQAAINATRSGGALLFPMGRYKVTQIFSGRCETTWLFDKAALVAGATTQTDCVLKFEGLHTRVFNMKIDMNFTLNYDCALWWYNAGESSQHNDFYGLDIHYAKRGIIYGAKPGSTSTLYAQSENNIFGLRTRGVEKAVYSNHGNGFLFLITPHLVAHDEEWSVFGPANGYDRTANRCFEVAAGHLIIEGGEVQNTIDPDGYCGEVTGGACYINNVITEVSVPFYVSAGILHIHGGRVLNTQSITPGFKVPSNATLGAVLKVSDCRIERNVGVGSFSGQPLVDNLGSGAGVDINFSNCEFDDWASTAAFVTDRNENVTFTDCHWLPNGNDKATSYLLDTNGPNLLDRQSIDGKGYTTDGFYLTNFYGGGTAITLSTDVPSAAFAGSIALNATGEAMATTLDQTSLATIKQTAIRVSAGDRFVVEGWVKKQSGNNAALALLSFDKTGAVTTPQLQLVADFNGGMVKTTWRYVRQVVTITNAATAYIGFGIYGNVAEVRLTGLQVRRADWGRR